MDWNDARNRFFKGLSKAPNYKSKTASKPSFYVNYESLRKVNGGFRGERLGFVKTTQPLPKIPKGTHYKNPRISFDGKYWYLSLSYEISSTHVDLTDSVIGVDLGVKTLATLSTGEFIENINKNHRVKQLENNYDGNNVTLQDNCKLILKDISQLLKVGENPHIKGLWIYVQIYKTLNVR